MVKDVLWFVVNKEIFTMSVCPYSLNHILYYCCLLCLSYTDTLFVYISFIIAADPGVIISHITFLGLCLPLCVTHRYVQDETNTPNATC